MRTIRSRPVPGSILPFFLYCGLALLLAGCSGSVCDDLRVELKNLYNSYIEDTAPLSEAEILQKCAAAKEQCPDLSMAYELAGLVHWENGRLKQALPLYIKAVTLAPNNTYDFVLADAQQLAFVAEEAYLSVRADGTVQLENFYTLSLHTYADCDPELRMLWCEHSLDKRRELSKDNSLGNGATLTMDYDITTPAALDTALLRHAQTTPSAPLYKVSGDLLIQGTGSIQGNLF